MVSKQEDPILFGLVKAHGDGKISPEDYIQADCKREIDRLNNEVKRLEESEQAKADELKKNKIRAVGYSIVVQPYVAPAKTAGGFMVSKDDRSEQQFHSLCCKVISVGSEAYDKSKAPWCKVGDWVVIARVSGVRLNQAGTDDATCLRIVNDDEIKAVIDNPEDFQIGIKSTKY